MNPSKNLLVLLLSFFALSGFAQDIDPGYEAPPKKDTIYTLDGDTLYSNAGFAIYIGQKLVVGKGSGENGWYRTISFRHVTAWPLLLFHDVEMKTQYDYENGEQDRDADMVKSSLSPDAPAQIKKIKRRGNRKHGYTYEVIFKAKGAPAVNFRCDIGAAISKGELRLSTTQDGDQTQL